MRIMIISLIMLLFSSGAIAQQTKKQEHISVTFNCRPDSRTFCNRSGCSRETKNLASSEFFFESKTGTFGAYLVTDCFTGLGGVRYDPDHSAATIAGQVQSKRPIDGSPPPGRPPFQLTLAVNLADSSFSAVWGQDSAAVVTDMGQCRVKYVVPAVRFPYDSVNVVAREREKLDDLARILAVQKEGRLKLVGHTDGTGSPEYALALGGRQAHVVADYLIGKGVAANRIMYESAGNEQPVDQRRTRKARDNNRRVEIMFVAE